MKLIIAGASGFVGQELVRQSLERSDITVVVALSRTPVVPPPDIRGEVNTAKLRSVIIKDYEQYPEEVRKEFEGAAACIWCVPVDLRYPS